MFGRLADWIRNSAAARWYAGKEPGERLTFGALAVAAAVVFLWAGVWKPVAAWEEAQADRRTDARNLLDWLKANETRARSAVEQGGNETTRSILPIVTRAAEARGLKVGRLQPESDGVVSVTLQDQAFNDLIGWIADLGDNQGITVVRASIDAQETAGLVNAQLRLQ